MKPVDLASRDLLLPAAILSGIFVYLSWAPALFNDGDTSWHIAAGRWMIAQGRIPQVDPFSFTHVGQPWTAHEWLSELLMAGAFALASWGGLAVLFATMVAGTLALIAGEGRRQGLSGTAIVVLLLSVFMVLVPYIVARPHLFSWPLLALWTILLLRAREASRAPPWVAALLMTLWANLHGSFLFGLLLVLPFALEALLPGETRRQVILGWGGFFALALVAALVTPHGVEGLLFPLQVSRMESLPLIMEWRPTSLAENPAFALVLAGAAGFALVRRLPIGPVRLLLLALLVYMAFAHVRHQALLAIVGSLLLVGPAAAALASGPRAPRGGLAQSAVAICAGLVLLVGGIRLAFERAPGDSESNPRTAIANLPERLKSVPVMNGYGFGGPLILSGIRPFIDGRADLYGDAHMFEHQRIIDGDRAAFDRAVQQWGIAWTMLPPDSRLAARLDRDPAWRRIQADRWAVVHEAVSPPAGPAHLR